MPKGRTVAHLRANAVAYLALFVALSGTAYAATKIGTKQLRNRAVTSGKLAPNAVNSSKIRNRSIQARDVSGALASGARPGKIVTRCGRTTSVPLVDGDVGDSFLPVPGVKGCTWSQPAGAIDHLIARVKVARSSACNGAAEDLDLRLSLKGGSGGPETITPMRTIGGGPGTSDFSVLLGLDEKWAFIAGGWNAGFSSPWTVIPEFDTDCAEGPWFVRRLEVAVIRNAS